MALTDLSAVSYELGPIRPPSEAYSLLVRVTRNCPWNRCKFCPIYKNDRFGLRPVEEIKRDIDSAKLIHDGIMQLARDSGGDDNIRGAAAAVYRGAPTDAVRNVALWTYAGGESVFLQDANTLIVKTNDLIEVIKYLKETFPSVTRITSYSRSKTAAQKNLEELKALHEAGLSRLHIGLESGYNPVLQFMDKGVIAADHIAGGKNVVASGISLCEYVMLGAGGKIMWREHALETARVLNEIGPAFIRFRTLTIQPRMPLYNDVINGAFVRSGDEEIVEEEKLLIENLECNAEIVSDHMINLLSEVEGKLPGDKEKMLAVINRFQTLSPDEKENFKLGRRLGLYNKLDDLTDAALHEEVSGAIGRLRSQGGGVTDEILFELMERYI